MKKLIFNRIISSQLYFKFKHYLQKIFFKKNNFFNKIYNDGFGIYDKKISYETVIKLNKYINVENFEFVNKRFQICEKDLKLIYKELNNLGVLNFLKTYLGEKIYCYDNSILILGTKKSAEGSWQPHHDSKGRRIKIYIWLNKKNILTHPLYYLNGSHKNLLFWKDYEHTRFPKFQEKQFVKIFGDIGEIIVFDTHGIHSFFKSSVVPRCVVELTFEACGFFNRLNDNFHSGHNEILRIKAKKLDYFLNN